jgi:orotidine-5'-phosphate decarboxylase
VTIEAKDRLIVALDVNDVTQAWEIVEDLHGMTGPFKIGLEAISAGIAHTLVYDIAETGGRVFWDGKFLDIPNTVGGAAKGLLKHHPTGIWAFNVHASGGQKMMEAAVENAGESMVLAVTLLTSFNEEDAKRLFDQQVSEIVKRWALEAAVADVHGLICSPQEVKLLKNLLPEPTLVTPGIRPDWAVPQDQARPTTPKQAILNGSDYIVVGRPITNPPEGWTRRSATEAILEEIEAGLRERGTS